MNFLKQRYGVSIENSWNKYQKKFVYYNITYRKYLQRKPLSKWLNNYSHRLNTLLPYQHQSAFIDNTIKHWKKKYDTLKNEPIATKSIGYGKSNGVIIEHIVSNAYIDLNKDNQLAWSWFYKKAFENITQKRFKLTSYLHLDNSQNHLHILYEPFKHNKVNAINYINPKNHTYYINTKQLNSLKKELNEIYIDNEYDNLIAKYSSLPKIAKFIRNKNTINKVNTFMKSQNLYIDFEKNLDTILSKEKEIKNDMEIEYDNN